MTKLRHREDEIGHKLLMMILYFLPNFVLKVEARSWCHRNPWWWCRLKIFLDTIENTGAIKAKRCCYTLQSNQDLMIEKFLTPISMELLYIQSWAGTGRHTHHLSVYICLYTATRRWLSEQKRRVHSEVICLTKRAYISISSAIGKGINSVDSGQVVGKNHPQLIHCLHRASLLLSKSNKSISLPSTSKVKSN